MSELIDACRAIQSGERSVDDVAEEFRARTWPRQVAASRDDLAYAYGQVDRDPDPPGSFSEVASAFYSGILTLEQYSVLAASVGEPTVVEGAGARGKLSGEAGSDLAADAPEPVSVAVSEQDAQAQRRSAVAQGRRLRASLWELDDSSPLACRRCAWSGSMRDGMWRAQGLLLELCCASCGLRIMRIDFPTRLETERAGSAGHRGAARELARIRFAEALDSARLVTAAQLPDLQGANLCLIWDHVTDDGQHFSVIRLDDTEIWRQDSEWEGSDTFLRVLTLLENRYGDRLARFAYTEESALHLFGDSLKLRREVDWILEERNRLRDHRVADPT